MFEKEVIDKIRDIRRRNLYISSFWTVHMMRIVMHYTLFDYELGLWCNSKAVNYKSSNQWLTKFTKKLYFYKNMRTNKNKKNLE